MGISMWKTTIVSFSHRVICRTKIEKRREVPRDLLDRVRMLSASFGSKASASARPYLGRPRRSL